LSGDFRAVHVCRARQVKQHEYFAVAALEAWGQRVAKAQMRIDAPRAGDGQAA